MDEARRSLVQRWLIKAQHDLATARKLADDPDPLLDTAIYHCQQAAEKAVKGFLAFHDQPTVKTPPRSAASSSSERRACSVDRQALQGQSRAVRQSLLALAATRQPTGPVFRDSAG